MKTLIEVARHILNETVLQESTKEMILYHGSLSKLSKIDPIKHGLWFATEPKNGIIDYYSSRGGALVKVLFTPSQPVLDLTDFDVNDNIDYNEVKDFIIDVLSDIKGGDRYIDEVYLNIDSHIEPRYDNNDYDDGYFTTSEIINWIISNIIIKKHLPVSAIMINESGYNTVVVFNNQDLEIIS